jgi:DNA-binding HxlR family transcriptional regulator
MKGYGQHCPMARAAEIFAQRWTPIIVRNLMMGCTTFTEILEGAPGLSRTLLVRRLRELERYGVIERRAAGRGSTYHLSASGRELADVCLALSEWGARWLEVAPEHLDAHMVLWSISRQVNATALPNPRIVVRVDLTDVRALNRFWLVLDRQEREVCIKPPGFPEDLVITTDTRWLVKWDLGWASLGEALRSGQFRIEGPPAQVRAFPRWGWQSRYAAISPKIERPFLGEAVSGGEPVLAASR